MKPLYVRALTDTEREKLKQNLQSASAFTVRRCQIVLKSADEHLKPQTIAAHLCCSDQAVREAIHAFDEKGLASLKEGSHTRDEPGRAFDEKGMRWLKAVVHRSPRDFGVERSVWTLQTLAEIAYQEGYSDRIVTAATISATLKRAGINWQRAKHWITSPDPNYDVKKNDGTG